MVTKTRDKLLDVARQLFARKGIENTTINDIAEASDKGRRTVYTYFRNKREIYNAVIERESENLVARLREVADDNSLSHIDKLKRYLEVRLSLTVEVLDRNEHSLRTLFSADIRRIERIRRLATSKEKELFDSIVANGVKAGVFDPIQAQRLPSVKWLLFQGIDVSRLQRTQAESSHRRSSAPDPIEAGHIAIEFIVSALSADHVAGGEDAQPHTEA